MSLIKNKLILAILTGCLMTLGWVPFEMPFFLFIGLIPALYLNDLIPRGKKQGFKYFRYLYLGFLIWNVLTTYWLSYAALSGFLGAALCNAALMAIPFVLYRQTKFHYQNRWGRLSIIPLFIAFEYLHFNWELSWSWLSLGNGLATFPKWIQWYSYTGVLGGSLWILSVNYFIYTLLTKQSKHPKGKIIQISWLFILPIITSMIMYFNYNDEKWESIEVTVAQPNFHSYTEKFSGISMRKQLDILIDISKEKVTPKTKFLIWPETAIHRFDYSQIKRIKYIRKTRKDLVDSIQELSVITGISGFEPLKKKRSAYTLETRGFFREEFNSACKISKDKDVPIYHKSKLVPLVERIPYQGSLFFMDWFSIDLSDAMLSLNIQEERELFIGNDTIKVVPAICFESVFGEYMTTFVDQGADFISILTNDSWWYYPEENGAFVGSQLGYLQHFNYARLRAIENRRYIARSANTGISGFIDAKGDIVSTTEYWQRTALTDQIKINDEFTFYTKNGDFIGRIMLTIALILILSKFVSNRTENFKYRN